MAELRRLDGTVLDVAKVGRNERIAEMLKKLAVMNERGEISAIVAVYVTPNTEHGVQWQLPDHDYGYPWGLALRGALVLAQEALNRGTVPAPNHPDEPDGA